jgi:hypothetical protein
MLRAGFRGDVGQGTDLGWSGRGVAVFVTVLAIKQEGISGKVNTGIVLSDPG